MKKLLILLLVLVLCLPLCACTQGPAETTLPPITHWEYPISPGSEGWFGVSSNVERLRIPEADLDRMTDEALVTAIAEYPYFIDIGLYSGTDEENLASLRKYFSALDELLARENHQEILKSLGQSYIDSAPEDDFTALLMEELIRMVCGE